VCLSQCNAFGVVPVRFWGRLLVYAGLCARIFPLAPLQAVRLRRLAVPLVDLNPETEQGHVSGNR